MSVTNEKTEMFFCEHCVLRIKAKYVEWGVRPDTPACPVCNGLLTAVQLGKGEHPDRVFDFVRNRVNMRDKAGTPNGPVKHDIRLILANPNGTPAMTQEQWNNVQRLVRERHGIIETDPVTKEIVYRKIKTIERQVVL